LSFHPSRLGADNVVRLHLLVKQDSMPNLSRASRGRIGGGCLRRGSGQNRWRRRIGWGAPSGGTRTTGPERRHRGGLLCHPPAARRANRQSACQKTGLIRSILARGSGGHVLGLRTPNWKWV